MNKLNEKDLLKCLKKDGRTKFDNGDLVVITEGNEIKVLFYFSPSIVDIDLTLIKTGKELVIYTHWREGDAYDKYSLGEFIEVISVFNKIIPKLTLDLFKRENV